MCERERHASVPLGLILGSCPLLLLLLLLAAFRIAVAAMHMGFKSFYTILWASSGFVVTICVGFKVD